MFGKGARRPGEIDPISRPQSLGSPAEPVTRFHASIPCSCINILSPSPQSVAGWAVGRSGEGQGHLSGYCLPFLDLAFTGGAGHPEPRTVT